MRSGGRESFDVVFCLNVLDRCKDPMRMVGQMHALLPAGSRSDGRATTPLSPRYSLYSILATPSLHATLAPCSRVAHEARAFPPSQVGGWLVVAVVLPPLQSDATSRVGGSQRQWRVTGTDFESAAASLLDSLLLPAGFEALRLVRAPYLCAGDVNSPVAVLDSAVVILRKTGVGKGGRGTVVAEAGPPAPAARRATSPKRPPMLPLDPSPLDPSERTAAESADSTHAHVDETRCGECDALGGYKFGAD